jgi:hypothetical protein
MGTRIHKDDVFGRLTAIKCVGRKHYIDLWLCKCICGTEVVVYDGNLRQGFTKSCGCNWKVAIGDGNRTHGERKGEYTVWKSMKQRCCNRISPNYYRYGGRGIRVCAAWRRSYERFLRDMGRRPAGYSIERKKNNLHYSCGKCAECVKNGWEANCRWATVKEQTRNKRTNRWITYAGRKMILADWATELRMSVRTLWYRVNHWTLRRAFTEPVRPTGR